MAREARRVIGRHRGSSLTNNSNAAGENLDGLTLLVAAGNRRYAVLVTDRRYTVDGRLIDVADNDRHKLVIARSGGFRMAVAFTGLARAGRFETAYWLANALRDALNPDGGFAMEAFAARATRDIGGLRIEAQDKLLWMLFVGFVNEGQGPQPAYAFVSNAGQGPEGFVPRAFQHDAFGPNDDNPSASYAMSMGAVPLPQRRIDALKALVQQDRPPQAAVGMAVEMIRAAANNPGTNSAVGTECSSAVIWADGWRSPELDYHVTRAVRRIPTPLLVNPQGVFELHFEAGGSPVRVPPVHRRAPCPCGSGRRYENCHRRTARTLVHFTTP